MTAAPDEFRARIERIINAGRYGALTAHGATSDRAGAWLVLTAGMLYDTISFRVDRMLHRRCCGLWTEDGMW